MGWHPILLVAARTVDGDPSPVAFDYEFPNYYSAAGRTFGSCCRIVRVVYQLWRYLYVVKTG